jgi:hypothetical protein
VTTDPALNVERERLVISGDALRGSCESFTARAGHWEAPISGVHGRLSKGRPHLIRILAGLQTEAELYGSVHSRAFNTSTSFRPVWDPVWVPVSAPRVVADTAIHADSPDSADRQPWRHPAELTPCMASLRQLSTWDTPAGTCSRTGPPTWTLYTPSTARPVGLAVRASVQRRRDSSDDQDDAKDKKGGSANHHRNGKAHVPEWRLACGPRKHS